MHSDQLSPSTTFFRNFKYKRTKDINPGIGYAPLKPRWSWRNPWRSLGKEAARSAGNAAAEVSLNGGASPGEVERVRKKAAAPFVGLRFHDLRHTAITKMAESDASDDTIMKIS